MALHIKAEANRCFLCKKPLCQEGCPIHTPIPTVIRLFKENRLMEAGEMLFKNNPMSAVCAIVCDHESQCLGHCIQGRKGNPIQFYEIEKFISDAYLDRMDTGVPEKKKKAVAVIGSGPAGITVAMMLAREGYRVTIFEERNMVGGMLRYGIPDYRLPNTILDRYRERMLSMGIQIRTHVVLGGDLFMEDLIRDGYSSIFIGTGAWRPARLGIQGESLANVHFGISYLANPESHNLGKTVAVIGTGNVAMDVARTAYRHGAQRVVLFERRRSCRASDHEREYAELDGAEILYEMGIQRILPQGPVFRHTILDENNSIVGYDEKEELFPADSTIIAVSQGPKDKLVKTTEGLQANDRGWLLVDGKQMTTRPGVFAAGDVVHGSRSVVLAVKAAREAAQAMMSYMESLPDEAPAEENAQEILEEP